MATLIAQSIPKTKTTPVEKRRLLLLMGPPTLALLLFFLLPIMVMGLYTFQTGTLGGEMTWSLDTYRRFWGNTALHRLLWRSTIVCVVISCPEMISAGTAA